MSASDRDGTVVVSLTREEWVLLLPGIQALSGVSGIPSAYASDAALGIDLIDMEAGARFPLHTHPGAHILFILDGQGTVTIKDAVFVTKPGDCYFVQGNEVHAVGAIEHHRLLAIGFPHKSIRDPHRMDLADAHFAEAQPELAKMYSGNDDVERNRLLRDYQDRGKVPAPEGDSE